MNAGGGAVLLDTHAAIWFVDGSLLETAAESVIAAGQNGGALLSPVSAWEIGLLARPRANKPPRVSFLPNPESWLADLVARPIIAIAPLTAEIALAASFLPGGFHADPADRMLVATARELGVPIVTRDRRILAYAAAGHVAAIVC